MQLAQIKAVFFFFYFAKTHGVVVLSAYTLTLLIPGLYTYSYDIPITLVSTYYLKLILSCY